MSHEYHMTIVMCKLHGLYGMAITYLLVLQFLHYLLIYHVWHVGGNFTSYVTIDSVIELIAISKGICKSVQKMACCFDWSTSCGKLLFNFTIKLQSEIKYY